MHLKRKKYEKLDEDLEFIRSGASQMNYLIQDILEFSQINRKSDVEKTELDLNDILEKVEFNLLEDIRINKAKILKEKFPTYHGNETEFILLFQNLIQNGIKYNQSDIRTIRIWASQSETTLNIHFKDNGIGINEEYHDKIFQFFKRLHTKDEYQGTGLCKKLIEKYEGTISVESEEKMVQLSPLNYLSINYLYLSNFTLNKTRKAKAK